MLSYGQHVAIGQPSAQFKLDFWFSPVRDVSHYAKFDRIPRVCHLLTDLKSHDMAIAWLERRLGQTTGLDDAGFLICVQG